MPVLAGLVACDDGFSTTDPGDPARVAAALVLEGDRSEGVVGRPLHEALVVRLVDERGEPVVGVTVRFDVAEGSGSISPQESRSDADGEVRGAWTLGPVAGEQRVEFLAAERDVALGQATATAHPGPPAELSVLPDEVTLPAGVPFVLEAQVSDEFGNRITTIPVEWGSDDELIARVSPEGRVTGLAVGVTNVAALPGAEAAESHPAIMEALASAGPARHHREGHDGGHSRIEVVEGDGAHVSAISGDGQTGVVGETLDEPIAVQVTDAEGAPLRKVEVTWRILDGGGAVSETTTSTDGQGRASVEWTLGSVAGTQSVEASVGDLGAVTFSATADDPDDDGTSDDDGSGDDGTDDDGAGEPGAVTDLAVVDAGSTSATLRFTEVDDGASEPADYQVRFALSPIGWGWGDAEPVDSGTCAGDVTGTGVGNTLTCTVEGLASGTEYDFQLIAHRTSSSGDHRVYGELSNVTTGTTDDDTTDDASDDDSSGDDEGSSSGMYPNEPSSNALIAWSPMSETFTWGPSELASGTGSWWQHPEDDPDTSIRTGSGVPGGPYYNRTRYAAGLSPGRAPVNWGGWDPGSAEAGTEQERIYFSQRLRLVDSGQGNWASHEVGTKLGFWAAGSCSGALNDVYAFLEGGTSSEFTLRMMQQNVTSRSLRQNRSESAPMKVGRWHHWEIEMILNDVGSSNGVLRWWVDGVLIMEHTDMEYRTAGDSCGFRAYKWNPTWGGMGGSDRSRDDFIDISDIRISGVPLR